MITLHGRGLRLPVSERFKNVVARRHDFEESYANAATNLVTRSGRFEYAIFRN